MAALSAQWGESESAAGRPEGGSAHEQLHKDEEEESQCFRGCTKFLLIFVV